MTKILKRQHFLFRVDSSKDMGTGHVMRCLTLADYLMKEGVKSTFLSSDLSGNINQKIIDSGHTFINLGSPTRKEPAKDLYEEWLGRSELEDAQECKKVCEKENLEVSGVVIDHYALRDTWQNEMEGICPNFFIIDDMNHRPFTAKWILNQNMSANKFDYPDTKKFLGIKYALLRPEFFAYRSKVSVRPKTPQNIIVSFGGNDIKKDSIKVAKGYASSDCKIKTTIILPETHDTYREVKSICDSSENLNLLPWCDDIAKLLSENDLCLGAGGASLIERVFLGLPSALVCVADNQKEICQTAVDQGLAFLMGNSEDLSESDYKDFFENLVPSTDWSAFSQKTLELSDPKTSEMIEEICYV